MSAVRCWQRWVLVGVAVLVLLPLGCSTDSEDPRFGNPLDPSFGEGLPVPEAIEVRVGDSRVHLSWSLPEGEAAEEYAVFRKRLDAEPEEEETLLKKVDEPAYVDAAVRNGRIYQYRIAAGVGGRFGPRSEEVEARPGLFAILIAEDRRVTADREVTVTLNAEGAVSVRLSEDADTSTGQWRSFATSVSWSLPTGDGTKTVYARFRLADGSESDVVSDSIMLDTRAAILSVEFDGGSVRAPGETIHVAVDAEEPDGIARVTAEGIFNDAPLFDDGTHGDATAADGVYEADLVIPAAASATDVELEASFTDLAGNDASSLTARRTISVHRRPEAVSLVSVIVPEPPDDPAVKVRWTRSLESRFSQYRLFRSEEADVDSLDELVHTGTDVATVEYTDADVHEGETWHYRVYVRNDVGLEAASNARGASIPNVRPPAAVELNGSPETSTERISLRWDRSEDRDFAFYRLYRNEDGAVNDHDFLVVEIDDPDRSFFVDAGLRENTSYYYRLYTFDDGGLFARSAEVEAKTDNEPPESVTLRAATDVDTTALTLSWEESDIHDFDFYRLYRDEIPTVTTGSTMVVELDDASFTTFRDTDLEIATRYYYRVFVYDDADEHAGSNTITIVTADTTGGGRP